ncbi:hypothetical protein A1OE_300 [Candidatus Endolissoclinum faulkneri L2]|uniref:Uncharacterized protein n=1 Tax=Candidatus Endolissoclinum faulkneri L2 TaxID=1193729 RepID=K7YPK9_9PROT|nr:hypothetical protein A1OE_300 [Candidatus Endolissoclinum faulkneri L2]
MFSCSLQIKAIKLRITRYTCYSYLLLYILSIAFRDMILLEVVISTIDNIHIVTKVRPKNIFY